MWKAKVLFIIVPWMFVGCAQPEAVRLTPLDDRPVDAVTVGDSQESALLVQQLGLEPIRAEGGRLYFVSSPAVRERLQALGYAPERVDGMQVERRTVRVHRRGEERDMLASGVRLINREAGYWVVSGTLEQLTALRTGGYRLAGVAPGEPRPREVLITLPLDADPASLGQYGLDLYSMRRTDAAIEITAGAFDAQIDALRAAGIQVDRISTVP